MIPKVLCAAAMLGLTVTAALALSAQQFGVGRTILASVVNTAGRPAVDLGVDDFVVTEDGDERDVLDAHVADYPVVILLDDSADARTADAMKRAAARFVGRVGERPVVVGSLWSTDPLSSLDQDRADILTQIANLPFRPSNPSAALPAVAGAARALKSTTAPFSAIIVVTATAIDAAAPVRGELLPGILESGAAVHVIEKRTEADLPDASNLLHVLTTETRGQFTPIYAAASFAVALDRLADRFATELMIEYLVPDNAKGGDVRVGVRRPGARVVGLGVSK